MWLSWSLFAAVDATPGTVAVPGGELVMGSKVEDDHRPPHKVQVTGFLLDRREVTNDQYAEFCDTTGHELPQFLGSRSFRAVPTTRITQW